MSEFQWDVWMLEEEARKRVGDLSIYRELYPFQDQYVPELIRIIELLPVKEEYETHIGVRRNNE